MKKLFTLFSMALFMLFSTITYAECDPPANLVASYSNNVSTFTWDAVPGAVDYTIEIKQSFDPWTSAEVVATVTTNTFNYTGIFHSAGLDWRVSTNCGTGVSGYTVAQYTVPCPAPSGLTVTNITAVSATLNWVPAPGFNTYVSDFVIAYRLAGSTNAWTQVGHTFGSSINVSSLAPATTYEWSVNQTCVYFNSNPVIAQFTTVVAACTAPTALVWNYSNNISTFIWNAVPSAIDYRIQIGWAGANWTTIENTVPSNSYTIANLMQGGNFQFRVRANCGSSFSSYTPIVFTTPCSAPVSQTTSNITTTSATLNWVPAIGNNNNTIFEIAYRKANTTAWTQAGSTTATFINVTGLIAGTLYEWKVTKICSVLNSNPVISQFTTTAPPCVAPTGLTSSGISSNQVTVNWNAVNYAVQYTVQYKPASSSTWVTSIITSALNATITGLSPTTLYDWRVMTNCSGSGSSYSTAQFTTTAPVACGIPTGLFANDITNNSAVLNWDAVSGASSYTLQYRILNSGGWVAVGNLTGTSYTLTNCSLMNTTYEFQVKAKCGVVFSAWSPSATFTTLSCVAYGNNAQEWIDLFKVGSINRVSGADAGGYINTGVSTSFIIGSSGNTGQISAGFASTINSQNYCIYIDLNRNGLYESTERVVGSSLISGAGNINFSFAIPGTATPGITGLRVSMRRNGSGGISPCMTTGYGETEDYTVNLIAVSSRGVVNDMSNNVENDTDDKIETGATVSPNPSDGRFVISLQKNSQPTFYEVVDMSGAVVQKKNIAGKSLFNVDITGVAKGLYLLRITDQSGKQQTHKLFKN